MNERLLLETATGLGYSLAMSGAETYRIEESVSMMLNAYGLEGEVFAIPNCLTVSIITSTGNPMTRMRRIGTHGNNLDAVEQFNSLSRRLCSQTPDPETAARWLEETRAALRSYPKMITALGYFMGSFGFAIMFRGTLLDALWSGLLGLLVFFIDEFMDSIRSTQFFRVITAAFFVAMPAYTIHALGLMHNADAAIIGTLMLLVPGLLFTNAMRDIMYGDTNSGLNRLVLVLLIAVAIALGTAAALWIANSCWGEPVGAGLVDYGYFMMNVGCLIGCVGFAMIFNIHGPGILICALGGCLAWSAYLLTQDLGGNVIFANLIGGLVASLYAELMARIRKFPAIAYLVVAIFPLIPGAGVYYTMNYAVHDQMSLFADKGMETAGVAGAIALGILLISTAFRLWSDAKRQRRAQKA